jgi:hypothetical protein
MTRPLPRKIAIYPVVGPATPDMTAIVRQHNDGNTYRATGRATVLVELATHDFSGLPTADPGGGRVWLKAGNLHVGS